MSLAAERAFHRHSDNLCAGGTLECGGLTPPWNYYSGRVTTTCEPSSLECCGSSRLTLRFAQYEGGVKPPRSKALRTFSGLPVLAGGGRATFMNVGASTLPCADALLFCRPALCSH